MTVPITKRQQEYLEFIKGEITRGHGPSFAEIGAAMGCAVSNVNRIVHLLEERGYLRLMPGKARGISLAEPLRASAISSAVSTGKNVFIRLHNSKSEVFAFAQLSIVDALAHVNEVLARVEAARQEPAEIAA